MCWEVAVAASAPEDSPQAQSTRSDNQIQLPPAGAAEVSGQELSLPRRSWAELARVTRAQRRAGHWLRSWRHSLVLFHLGLAYQVRRRREPQEPKWKRAILWSHWGILNGWWAVEPKWCKNTEEEFGVRLARSLNACGPQNLGNEKQQKILKEKKGGN